MSLAIANQRARESGSAEVWPEDILLVLLRRPTGRLATVFTNLAVDLPMLEAAIARLLKVPRGPAGVGKLPTSKEAKETLAAAVVAANGEEAGAEHILLGVLSGNGPVTSTLNEFGLNLELVRKCVSRLDRTRKSVSRANDPATRHALAIEQQKQAEERIRLGELDEQLRRWINAQNIRGLVTEVRGRAASESGGGMTPSLEAWLVWATARADHLDPVDEILRACL